MSAAARCDDPLLRGDLVSDDGTVTAVVVSFDEDRIDDVRGEVIDRIHQLVDPRLPPGMTRALQRQPRDQRDLQPRHARRTRRTLTPPILVLTIGAIYFMFRSWRITVLLIVAVLVSAVWTMGLFVADGVHATTCWPACCRRW